MRPLWGDVKEKVWTCIMIWLFAQLDLHLISYIPKKDDGLHKSMT